MIHHPKKFLRGFIPERPPVDQQWWPVNETQDLLLSLGGNVVIEVHPAGRPEETIQRIEVHNKVVTSGLTIVRDCLGDAGIPPKFISLGEDATTTLISMTALGQERYRDRITRRYVVGNAIYFELYVGEDYGNGYTYQEAGLFCNSGWAAGAAAIGGTMFARTTFTPVTKSSAISMTLRWTITISSGN